MDKKLNELLNYDIIDAVEKITGERVGRLESPATALALLLGSDHSAMLNKELADKDDTTLSNDLDNYIRIVTDLGFEKVLELPFIGRSSYSEETHEEKFFIFAHRDGILLKFESYCSDRVNSSNFYYNYRITGNEKKTPSGLLSSYHVHNGDFRTIVGDHDGRQAIRHKIGMMREHGVFVSPWLEKPFLWLLHYMDTKDETGKDLGYRGYDHDAINNKRIAMLPDWVKAFIG